MTVISRFMTGRYSVLRTKSGTYVKGTYIYGPQERISIRGSLQPTNARELKLPEEGNRLRQYWKLFSDRPVLVDSMATLAKGDQVEINGEQYRAMAVTHWMGVRLAYYETILWREPEQRSDGKAATS